VSRVEHHKKLAILVGGGPAPGINSVIGAATIRAALEGLEVVGVRDGFEGLMHGEIERVTPLTIDAVSRIHFRGGSHIGISRANPTSDPKHLENVVISLQMVLECPVIVGGRTALELQGFAHYLSVTGPREVHLYGDAPLPTWVGKLKLDTKFVFHNAKKLFPNEPITAGLGAGFAALDLWPVLVEQWLRDQGLLTPIPKP